MHVIVLKAKFAYIPNPMSRILARISALPYTWKIFHTNSVSAVANANILFMRGARIMSRLLTMSRFG